MLDKKALLEQIVELGIFDNSSNFQNFKENVKKVFGFMMSESLLKEFWISYRNYGI